MLTANTRQSFQSLLDAISLNAGDDPAIIFVATGEPPITISRTDFVTHARHYAMALQAQDIQQNDLVIIAHAQIVESIYAFWGALLIGAVPSMFPTLTEKLDPTIYAQNLAQIVDFSDVRAIITNDDFAPNLKNIVDCPIISELPLQVTIDLQTPTINPEDIAFLQHSSGTTGLQKGVALSHEAVLNQLASYSDAIALTDNDVIISWLPLYHDMGLIAGFLLPLVQGIPLVLMSPFDWVAHPALLLNAIDSYRATLCWLPNFAYNHMARRIRQRDTETLSLASMRAFINCSEPVRDDSQQKFLDRFADCGMASDKFSVSYAMAENTFAVTQTPIGTYPQIDIIDPITLQEEKFAKVSVDGIKIISCGFPLKNTKIQIIDDNQRQLAERHIGEILIKSDCMLNSYHNRPDLEPLLGEWYKTGDMGYLAEGQLYIVGRKKDLIITAGKNVYPQDIEAIVNTINGIHQGRCVVFGIPDEREGTELIVVVAELDEQTSSEPKIIKKAIRQAITDQSTVSAKFISLVPKKWLIKTSSGKIARDANRRKWLEVFDKA
ncbi:MAG: hypothetical protein Phog2KO_00050 [Phototrophicaceae bacterium]